MSGFIFDSELANYEINILNRAFHVDSGSHVLDACKSYHGAFHQLDYGFGTITTTIVYICSVPCEGMRSIPYHTPTNRHQV